MIKQFINKFNGWCKVRLAAYNLQNMLLALALMGILMMFAVPKTMPLIVKFKSSEAQAQLKYIHTLQEMFFYTNSRYADNFTDIYFEAPKSVKAGGNANYSYEIISAGAGQFKATATAIIDFDSDGIYNVWEINENGVPKQKILD
ncbi:type IV pilin protein [Dokdonia sp. Hel_I_53]|uniref:type IV pilin protein n=1 Tax=Dokdonia sp. Hel_I_53 TaxID=1566287 RepID=UPI00119B06CF|nr:general secretion pathway protein GspG [Dokdonia sp. Hel_I_53]TVZ52273.1 type II secretion system protein G (GspG) [Dokdonia sp. Hel_I_53]